MDVSKEEDVDKVLKDVAKHFGRIDYVVNAAGIAKKHAGGAAFVKTDDWKRVIDVNMNGTFFVLRAAAAIMLEQEPILSSKSRSPVLACVLTSRKCYNSFFIRYLLNFSMSRQRWKTTPARLHRQFQLDPRHCRGHLVHSVHGSKACCHRPDQERLVRLCEGRFAHQLHLSRLHGDAHDD